MKKFIFIIAAFFMMWPSPSAQANQYFEGSDKLFEELQGVKKIYIQPPIMPNNKKQNSFMFENEFLQINDKEFGDLFLRQFLLSAQFKNSAFNVPVEIAKLSEDVHPFLLIQYHMGYQIMHQNGEDNLYGALFADLYYFSEYCPVLLNCGRQLLVTYPIPFLIEPYRADNISKGADYDLPTVSINVNNLSENAREPFFQISQEIIVFLKQNKFFNKE